MKFKQFDFFSKSPSLYIDGNTKYNSNLGSLLTILSVILSISGFLVLFNKISNREEVYVSNSSSINYKSEYLFNTSEILFVSSIRDAIGGKIDYSYYNIVAQNWKYIYTYDGNVYKESLKKYSLNVSKCSEIHRLKESKYYKHYANFDFSGKYCIDPGQIIDIYGPFGSTQNYSYLNIYATHCKGINCKNFIEIQNKLSVYYLM